MTTLLAIALGAILFLGSMSGSLGAQTPLDPKALIGEWSGTWQSTGPDAATVKGQYTLTIKNIEGTRAYCDVFTTGPRGRTEGQPIATLQGNRLSWGGQFATEFTISGTDMNGSRQGGPGGGPVEIKLKKK
ncbi:MAG TPA: hypothetical protein VFU40_12195 [Gemmatimonadales bacterium]|nr:hypothetical protein [Gemmatimonadales bacterium]